MATSSSRDARRRRIAERGSDRLALITGRLDSLPSSKSFSDPPPSVVPQNEDKDYSPVSHGFSNDPSQHDNYGGQTGIEQRSVQSDLSSQESRPSALDTDEKKIEGSPISTSNVEHQSTNIDTVINRIYNGLSPRQITVAVAASEMIRFYCSLTAAILVFLSYIGFPILGNGIIRSAILSRPLYLLLVTNITVVLVPLLLDRQRQVNSCAEASGASPLGAFQFGKALEIGMMLQQVSGGLFMDCSLYSVVVVCLLSLAQKFGW